MTLQEYTEFKAQTSDPVYLCFLIYNKETKAKQLTIQEFQALFNIWLHMRTSNGLVQSCAMLRGYFDSIIK